MVKTTWVTHPQLAQYCQKLATIRAQRLVQDLATLPVVIPPMFGWADLGDAVGRKAHPQQATDLADGQDRYLMPVRLQYADDQHMLIGDGPHQVECVAIGPGGFREECSWELSPQPSRALSGKTTVNGQLVVDQAIVVDTSHQHNKLLNAGHEALWDILVNLEQQLIAVLEQEHHNMRSELYATIGTWSDRWVSTDDIEHLASSAIHNPSQPLMRALDAHVYDQQAFNNVDPLRHMAVKVRQEAKRLMYDAIGDLADGLGTRIRNAASQLKCKDPDTLPKLMLEKGLTDVLHHRASIVTALNPVPRAAVAMDGVDLDSLPARRGGQAWH